MPVRFPANPVFSRRYHHAVFEGETLGVDAVDAIASLCRRGAFWPPCAEELRDSLFCDDQPAVVRGDPDVGVVATVRAIGDPGSGHIRLMVVDPARCGRGVGRALLAAAERDLADCRTITFGADGPWYLYAGVPAGATDLCVMAERARYHRVEANLNMEVLLDRRFDGTGARIGGPADIDAVAAWSRRHWAWWADELVRATERSTVALVDDPDDEHGIAAAGAWDVVRRGVLGPFCSRPDLIGTGRGAPTIAAALEASREAGRDRVEIGWVGPLGPYARFGATIGRTFYVYRKDMVR
jgi:GNAT superfamily N-acetyltransferase